jgi:non-ribosomal peptide synthetase-like protein
MMVMNYLNELDDYYSYLACAPIIALSFIVLLCLEIVVMKWLLLGRVKPGQYSLHSFFYFRKWFVDQLLELSLDVLGPLYSTLYLAPWYRMLGKKLGANAEVSTASFISPDLLSIDDESFIADSVSLGAARVRDGTIVIAQNRIGKRSFIGNSALLPPGSVIADNCLIGCLSRAPDAVEAPVAPDSSWLGSPAFPLPQRQVSAGFSEATTFKPSLKLRAQRTVLDFFRVILPSTGFVMLTCLLLSAVVLLHDEISPMAMLLLFPILYAGCGLLAALAVIAAKWILIGKYRPAEKPLWCTFVWRNELVTSLHEDFSDMFLTSMLAGTPYLPWFLRALGAKIGKRTFLETTQFTEYDLVEIGDDVALNLDCTIQTHLFEDRVFKMSNIVIESGCNVGALSLVLYDTRMEQGSSLGDLSLLMKGETLPPGTRWEGIPARSHSTDGHD